MEWELGRRCTETILRSDSTVRGITVADGACQAGTTVRRHPKLADLED